MICVGLLVPSSEIQGVFHSQHIGSLPLPVLYDTEDGK